MYYDSRTAPQQVASSGGRNAFSDIYDNFNTAVSGFGKNLGSSARTAGGAASGAVGNAMDGARGAYGAVKRFIPGVGGALAVVGGGLEAKGRLDRGEDGQRAAIGGAASTLGGIVGGGLGMLTGNPLIAMATSAAGSSAAGFLTDRATDFVRGNDGKGTDSVVRDMDGQITAAQGRGDFGKATQLMAQQGQFIAGRNKQNESPYMQGNRANAGDYGVGPDAQGQFDMVKNNAGIGDFAADQQFAGNLRRDGQAFNQNFGQRKQLDKWAQALAYENELRTASVGRTNQMNSAQTMILQNQPQMMQNATDSALRYAAQVAGTGFR